MPLYKFSQSDIFHNRIEAHPQCNFFIYSGSTYYNNRSRMTGSFVTSMPGVLPGHISLYELNIDRVSGSIEAVEEGTFTRAPDIIYPFIYKDGNNNRFRGTTLATVDGKNVLFDEAVEYGDLLTGSYPMSASISKDYLAINHVQRATDLVEEGTTGDEPSIHPYTDEFGYPTKSTLGSKIAALKTTLDSYTHLSPHYAYSSASYANRGWHSSPSVPSTTIDWNKGVQEMGLISIPSIFYGRRIKKGTVNLKFYISGTLIGELNDENKNGELVQVGPTRSPYSGSTAGVVLYNEGFILLTGSWDLTAAPVASSVELNFNKVPSNNDTVVVINAAGTEKTFKFNTGNSTVDGTLHSDGTSVNVGVSSADDGGANRFKNAINNADFDITATRSGRLVTLTQDSAGLAGNTDIEVNSLNIGKPTPSRFSAGVDGASAPAKTENYYGSTATSPRWIDFAQAIATGSVDMPSSSFELDFKGTQYIPVMTMLAHARKGHLSFSNNPTYIKHSQSVEPITGSTKFREQPELQVKNIVSSSYQDFTASYRRQTYISKIGIYDAKRNLIGIAKVATPVKKTEDRDFTFKLKLDI